MFCWRSPRVFTHSLEAPCGGTADLPDWNVCSCVRALESQIPPLQASLSVVYRQWALQVFPCKGRSPSDPLFRMSQACACKEASMPCYVCYERIASHSNPADLPSRERAREACDRWCLNFEGDIALPVELLTALVDDILSWNFQRLTATGGKKEDDLDVRLEKAEVSKHETVQPVSKLRSMIDSPAK